MTFMRSSSGGRRPGSPPSAPEPTSRPATARRRAPRKGPARARPVPPVGEVRITAVGAEADGLARHPDGSLLFVPRTLPGELVRVRPLAPRGDGWLAEPLDLVEPSGERIAAGCRHFGTCGGCALQNWDAAGYLAWKRSLLISALERAGYAHPPVAPVVACGPAERRRMDLAVRRTPTGVRLGLHRMRAADVVDLTECRVLQPMLAALLEPLRALCTGLQALGREGAAIANLLDSGPDLLLRTDGELTIGDRIALRRFASEQGIARISWARGMDMLPETACLLRPPVLTLSGVSLAPPPGAFLQATRTGEEAIVAAVLDALPDRLPARARAAELYAGCGTLSFALAERVRVTAWEGNPAAVEALRSAANRSGLAGRIEARQRDLLRQPLQRKEFAGFSAIVLDPPHEGAPAQITEIASSGVNSVIYVSCNPASLARDAVALRQAGYGLAKVQPIDQFLWSARLESVARFVLRV